MQSQPLWRELFGIVFRAVTVLTTIILVIVTISVIYESSTDISDGQCNIAVLPIEGVIVPFQGLVDFPLITTPASVEAFFNQAEDDPAIKAIVLEINSPGGTPVAAERIAERIKASSLPVIGLIGDIGASGAYLVASAASAIIASPMSDIGGIGVTMSYVEESKKNEEEGLTFVELAAGKFKDVGNPNKPLTAEERERLEADLDSVYQEFISQIAINRNLDRDTVVTLADGATMPGERALSSGLIDHLGTRATTTTILAEQLGLTTEEIIYCEYNAEPLLF